MWCQRSDRVYVTIKVADCVRAAVHVNDGELSFSGHGHGARGTRDYALSLRLAGAVVPSRCCWFVCGPSVRVRLEKEAAGPYWDSLMVGVKPPQCKIDWQSWIDEDEECEVSAAPSGFEANDLQMQMDLKYGRPARELSEEEEGLVAGAGTLRQRLKEQKRAERLYWLAHHQMRPQEKDTAKARAAANRAAQDELARHVSRLKQVGVDALVGDESRRRSAAYTEVGYKDAAPIAEDDEIALEENEERSEELRLEENTELAEGQAEGVDESEDSLQLEENMEGLEGGPPAVLV
ncbi:hypothetical protein EMIHUDRAFT_449481 [Emiliania huxleyi CCMP1516]|uniref:CS domain-containing protein n=2 Tax=Emiliania huxleyi TaxID=2903 RepID=A0A0D3K8E6_EMIH1|nr:hypothetical protein EMIHUDRAFT_449481 [Emiliania huxleyi CCMP1516]EOD32031.1 hypothetical protein EMIHUDRAFT_449481 [Emiliania huxleyi CCMP1516]|eukprot:XP_005784460.1 hypothetical protein EMIHUDRAFT_449481 [Emiliania huxleyi CCMP1516]